MSGQQTQKVDARTEIDQEHRFLAYAGIHLLTARPVRLVGREESG